MMVDKVMERDGFIIDATRVLKLIHHHHHHHQPKEFQIVWSTSALSLLTIIHRSCTSFDLMCLRRGRRGEGCGSDGYSFKRHRPWPRPLWSPPTTDAIDIILYLNIQQQRRKR